jgi:ABC-type glycerol-3-phosphate transport system substrate-binding protein
MKRTVAFLLIALMVGSLFGCAKMAASNELWIVTEATTWDRMNGQIAAVAEQFEKDHEGITVRIDILPTDEQERSVYLQSLRTQILRGKGPDAYLLPTSTRLMVDAPKGYTAITVEPLFPDVVQAMENGMFRDISSLYDKDAELGKEEIMTWKLRESTVTCVIPTIRLSLRKQYVKYVLTPN